MAIEIVDGMLEPIQPRSTKRGYGRFERLKIRKADGSVREFPKVATGAPVTEQVIQGGEGRYYFTTADGPMGLYGVRRPDGSAYYAHFTNVEPMILVVGVLGTIAAVAKFGLGFEQLPMLASILGPFLLIGWFYLNGKRKAAKRVFDAENT